MQPKNKPVGIPLRSVRFREVKQFAPGQRAIEIDVERTPWARDVKMRWLTNCVEVLFPNGESFYIGLSSVDTAKALIPRVPSASQRPA